MLARPSLTRFSSANPAAPVRTVDVNLGERAEGFEILDSGDIVEDCFEERRRFRGPWATGEATDRSSSAVGVLDAEEVIMESAINEYASASVMGV